MSANENDIKLSGSFNSNKDSRGGANTIPSAVIGIVKNNIDPTRSGRIEVFLLRSNAANQDSPASWVPVNYMSPFFGYTPNTASKDDNGSYVGNPNSYGMWMTPPDIGTEVLCVFLNGDINFGYYIGALPKPGMTYMVPAVGANDYVIANESEAKSYGGATRLPVTEFNDANKSLKNSAGLTLPGTIPRPIHSYQATILFNQGLLKDSDRGAISSSSMRESPSQVFGISTPGRPIYQGGYDDTTIGDAIKADDKNENFKIIGRRGGHSFVMDDGDLYGKDQLIRLRTATGHMILMNDYAQTLMIMHANGQSYIELGREGTIDMYSTNSVNIRTEGDLNLHADRNININANGDLNMSGKNTKVEALQTMTQYAGDTFAGYSKGDYTVKTESNFATDASGDIGHKAKGTLFINGGKKKPNVKINSGDISTTPKSVGQIGVSVLSDTLFDDTKGYNPAPAKLTSIVNRAPAHMPWADAGKGVDVKTDKSASSAFPSPPSNALSAGIALAPKIPLNPTNTTFAATVPGLADVSNLTKGLDTTLNNPAMTSMVSQMAVTAALGPMGPAVAAGGLGAITNANGTKTVGVGNFALNASQMSTAGIIKPGSEVAVNYAITSGKDLTKAFPNNIFTGQNGVTNLNQYLNDTSAQAKSAASLLSQGEGALKSAGVITGNEHATQTAGLIMSTAGLGLKATTGFLSGGNTIGSAAGSAKDLVAGGNFAANLADKSMVALSGIKLGGIDVASAVKGFASSLFSSVLSAFKPLKANVPQNLTKINAPPDPTSISNAAASAGDLTGAASALGSVAGAAADVATKAANDPQLQGLAMKALEASVPGAGLAMAAASAAQSGQGISVNSLVQSQLNSAIPGVNVASLGGLPGGADAISSNSGDPVTSAGMKNISSSIQGISGSINSSQLGSSIDSAKSLLAGGSLATAAMTGIDPAQLSKLNSLLSAIGHGALNIALPSTISNAFKTDGLLASAKAKLGGKVPPPTFGTGKAPDTNTAGLSKVEGLSQTILAEQTNYVKLNDTYQTAIAKYGDDSSQAKAAYAEVTKSIQTIETLQSQITKTVVV
jgi:hypothetical protein